MAIYHLLVTLCFHHYLTAVTKVAFALTDQDKQGIAVEKLPQHQQAKARRRCRFKGAQAFQIDEDAEDPDKGYTMMDFFKKAHSVTDLFWAALMSPEALDKTHFAVPAVFWPRQFPKDDMYKRMTLDILKTLCALKWRVFYKEATTPFCFLKDTMSDAEPVCQRFLAMPSCCLDAHWGRPVQKHVKDSHSEDQGATKFANHMKTFMANARIVSHREETMHAQQRTMAGGFKSKAQLFSRQASEMVLATCLTHYERRTNISVQRAPERLKQAGKVVRARKVVHKRPRQMGSSMFLYVAEMRKNGSDLSAGELRTQWRELPNGQKNIWKRKQALVNGKKRLMKKKWDETKAQADDNALSMSEKSPWQLGDDRYPLHEKHVVEWMSSYKNKANGLNALGKFQSPEALDHARSISEGKPYHATDACMIGSRASLGEVITNPGAIVKDIMNVSKQEACCLEKHPGVCKDKDWEIMSAVDSLVRSFPKGNHLLMIETCVGPVRERFALFVRCVTGLAGGFPPFVWQVC